MNSRVQKEQFPSLQVLQSEGLKGAAWASAPQGTPRLSESQTWFSPESFPLKHRNVQQQNTEIADIVEQQQILLGYQITGNLDAGADAVSGMLKDWMENVGQGMLGAQEAQRVILRTISAEIQKASDVQVEKILFAVLAKTLPNIQVTEELSAFLLAGGSAHEAILKRAQGLLEACKDAQSGNGANADAIMKALFCHMEACKEPADFTEAVIALVSLSSKAHRGEGGLASEKGLNWSPNFGRLQTVFMDGMQTIEERTKMLQAASALATRGGLPAILQLSVLSCALTRASGVDSRFSETELGVLGILEKQALALAQETAKHQHGLKDTFFVHVNTVRKALGVSVGNDGIPVSNTTWHSAGRQYGFGISCNMDPQKQGSTPGAPTFKLDIGEIERDDRDYRTKTGQMPLPSIFQYLNGGNESSYPLMRLLTLQVPANDKILPPNSPLRNAIQQTGVPLCEIPVYVSVVDIKDVNIGADTFDFNRHFNLMSHTAIYDTMHVETKRTELCGIFPVNDCVGPSGDENDTGFNTLKAFEFNHHDSDLLSGDIARFKIDPNKTGQFWAMTHDRHHNNVVLELFIVNNSGTLLEDIFMVQNPNLSAIEKIEALGNVGSSTTKASVGALLEKAKAALS